ncbi:TniB family NTP-binding protein [Pseudomonas sp. CHM02]|uniref:TniB family NTP-binding protein n=1 Tax=Pseudomonas sp. CHM02 TaxID=1463662 RepID=UPI00046E5EC7|nr:TniB family NTP-binding protein [Pseudomonas sp. CHM02]
MYDHLSPRTAVIAQLSDEERIDYCRRNFFIMTGFSKRVIDDVRGIIRMERGGTTVCRALVGRTGIGKSTLIKAIATACNTPDSRPVEVIDLSPYGRHTDLHEIFVSLLGFTGAAKKLANPNGLKLIKGRVAERGLKMLIFDEANALVSATRTTEGNTTFLRGMSNEDIGLNLMVAGTKDISSFLRKNDQLPSRFGRLEMQDWDGESKSFSLFLNGYMRYLPLRKASMIDTAEMIAKITSLAGHLTRDIARVLSDAAIYAIVHGEECITLKVLQDSYNEALAFYAPDGVMP